jgi:hypothetical protein
VLPAVPTSAAQLENYQFRVRQLVAQASCRGSKRIGWLHAITSAKDPAELRHVSGKCQRLDRELAIAALTACEGHPVLDAFLSREGKKADSCMEMLNCPRSMWRIYHRYAQYGESGLKVHYAVINLPGIQLIDGDRGLERFWGRWRDCGAGARHLPDCSEYQDLFVDEMRKSELTKLYVRDFDEMPAWDKRETWERLEELGRFVRERVRVNQQQAISALHGEGQGETKTTTWPSPATPGEDGNPGDYSKGKCKMKPKGEGQGTSQSTSNGMSGSDGQSPKWEEKNPRRSISIRRTVHVGLTLRAPALGVVSAIEITVS